MSSRHAGCHPGPTAPRRRHTVSDPLLAGVPPRGEARRQSGVRGGGGVDGSQGDARSRVWGGPGDGPCRVRRRTGCLPPAGGGARPHGRCRRYPGGGEVPARPLRTSRRRPIQPGRCGDRALGRAARLFTALCAGGRRDRPLEPRVERTQMRVGAIDIGTNTVRLLVADVADGAIAVVERRAEVVALGEGVDRWGRLADEAIARTVARLAEYRAITAAHGVGRLRVVATSASRDADNYEDFLDQAERVLGVRPDVMGGDEEAALSCRGATSGLPGPGPTLVIDPGGGSTEFVVGDIEPVAFTSVDIGSVRLTERLFPDHPASDEQVAAAAAVVAAVFASVGVPLAPGGA